MDGNAGSQEARLERLEAELALLKNQLAGLGGTEAAPSALVQRAGGQEDRLSLIVFSGSLDRLIAAFVLATGAAAMGMKVSMFFTFWGTSALRRQNARVQKNLLSRMFGWML